MEAALSDLVAWLESLRPVWLYVAVMLIAYVENVVPPIPGDLLLVFAGYLVGVGHVALAPLVALATVGGTLGFMTMYYVGWRVGTTILDANRMRWVPKQAARRALAWTARYGYAVVAANRFLAGARSVIALTVGAARMDPARTALWAAASAGAWGGLLIWAGFIVGDNWAAIGGYLRVYGKGITVGLLVLLAAFAVRRWLRSKRGRRRTGEDLPGGGPRTPTR